MQHGAGLPRLADQRVHPRRMQVRLIVGVVAELAVVAVRPHHPFLARGAGRVGQQRVVGEERIQAARDLLRPVHRLHQARHVLLHQPLVLPGRALVEAVLRTRIVMAIRRRVPRPVFGARPWEAGEAGLRIAHRWIPDRTPVAPTAVQHRRVLGMPQRTGHGRQRAIGQRVLQRRRAAVVRVDIHALGRKRAVVLHEALRQVVGIAGTPGVARIQRWHLERIAAQRGIGLSLAPLQRAEAPQVDQERRDRVAGHHVGLEVGIAPARQPAALRVDRQDRTADVGGALRPQQRQQLVLRTIGVPQREELVVGPAVGVMDAVVVAAVTAIGVAAGQRLQQRVVQRGVEHHAVVAAGALHAHAGQFLVPGLLRTGAHRIEAEQAAIGHALTAQVVACALGVHVRDRRDGGDRAALAQVEGEPRAAGLALALHAMPRARHAAGLAPGAERLEWAIELQAEPGGVLVAAAEALRHQLAFHHAVADHGQGAAGDRVAGVGLADVDQHVALARGAEGVALGRGAGQRGGFGIDAAVIGQPHLVVAGLAALAVVLVARAIAGVVERLRVARIEIAARTDAPGHRQHRDLAALLPTAGTGQEGMAEAADLRIVVAPAGVVRADRADLDHAERSGRTGEGVAVVLAADEGVDLGTEPRRGGQCRRHQQQGQGERAQQGGQRGRRHAMDPVVDDRGKRDGAVVDGENGGPAVAGPSRPCRPPRGGHGHDRLQPRTCRSAPGTPAARHSRRCRSAPGCRRPGAGATPAWSG
ncbi:hypothetical protein NB717_000617 [Xanthomonas sacchari]|nr:hypothetical protein [Xanthomonas sacchari]